MMISRATSAENRDILEPLVQVSPNIIKIKIRNSIRQKEKIPKVVEPISYGKKRIRFPPLIPVQVPRMAVPTYV